jgi:hypothetical protein
MASRARKAALKDISIQLMKLRPYQARLALLPPRSSDSSMIHYHGLPMTPLLDMLRAMRGRHAMVSFETPRQIQEATEVCQSVALDNGAFSAWRQNRTHDFDGYAEWAAKWLRHPCVNWCLIPDVIDGSESANDRLLAEWPLDNRFSVPVFHLHESLERLEHLVSRYPRIALGSSGAYCSPGKPRWWKRMAQIMRVICTDDVNAPLQDSRPAHAGPGSFLTPTPLIRRLLQCGAKHRYRFRLDGVLYTSVKVDPSAGHDGSHRIPRVGTTLVRRVRGIQENRELIG